jgi:uncharacterized membrane protein
MTALANQALTRREQSRQIEARIALILRAGVMAAAALLTVSLPWIVIRDGAHHSAASALSVGEALRRLPFDPRGMAALGVIILVATPILQLVASAVLFWHKRDRLYLGFTMLVGVIVAAGAFVAAA